MLIEKFIRWKKRRKYPINRDASGKTARQRCFEMFEDEIPLEEIARLVDVKADTISTYYRQWKRNPTIEKQLTFIKTLLNKNAPDRERTIELLAQYLMIPKEQLETILHQPHGLRRLITQKFYFPLQAKVAHRRYVALELAMWIADYMEKHGGSLEDLQYTFEQWMQENKQNRAEEDEDIEAENRSIDFTRKVLDVSAEQERQGRVQPDRLTPEERDNILRDGVKIRMKRLETTYWLRITELIGEGLTVEQAREKIYQDLIDKGDIEGAKQMREYQNAIHPLKPGRQPPPTAPEPPPVQQ